MEGSVDFPWPYRFRRSQRARYMRIILKAGEPIEVVYPRWSSKVEAFSFLQDKLSWIEGHTQFLKSSEPSSSNKIPECIEFPGLNQIWHVNIKEMPLRQRITVHEVDDKLTISGSVKSSADLISPLRTWLRSKAILFLQPQLEMLAEYTGLEYRSVSWRFQRTRWGSCSDQKRISLNVKLLLLPAHQIRYVLLHELCHTRHMNHGLKF